MIVSDGNNWRMHLEAHRSSLKITGLSQIITLKFWVFVHENHEQVLLSNQGDTHQLREPFRNSFILLPMYGKLYVVPQVMTRGIVTTNEV